jgi:hypothetical protein
MGATTDADLPMPNLIWYAGIGSMMSPTALSLRKIYPRKSLWCSIDGFRKIFVAPSGMATLYRDEDAVAHCVAHLITPEELKILEGREPPSQDLKATLRSGVEAGDVIDVKVSISLAVCLHGLRPENVPERARVTQEGNSALGFLQATTDQGFNASILGSQEFNTVGMVYVNDVPVGVPALVTQVCPEGALPSARYHALMVEGAKASGFSTEELDLLQSMETVPRKAESECLRMQLNPEASETFFTKEDIQAKASTEAMLVFRGMVFHSDAWKPDKLPPMMQPHFGCGADVAAFMSTQFYDPLYGFPPTDLSTDWPGWASLEDMACSSFLKGAVHVGVLR